MYACSKHASPGQNGSLLRVLGASGLSVLIIYSSHVRLGLGEKWAGLSSHSMETFSTATIELNPGCQFLVQRTDHSQVLVTRVLASAFQFVVAFKTASLCFSDGGIFSQCIRGSRETTHALKRRTRIGPRGFAGMHKAKYPRQRGSQMKINNDTMSTYSMNEKPVFQSKCFPSHSWDGKRP